MDRDGAIDGSAETEGLMEGVAEGLSVGICEGLLEGNSEGAVEGLLEGDTEGFLDGASVAGEGIIEGTDEWVNNHATQQLWKTHLPHARLTMYHSKHSMWLDVQANKVLEKMDDFFQRHCG